MEFILIGGFGLGLIVGCFLGVIIYAVADGRFED